jgi:8-oxo-dGTP pyrophosphatase MutT (NUDIX family)
MKIERPPSKQFMPPDAKLVFKGVIFDVYQWEQEMFDGTKSTFEKLKRADTTVVIPITSEGKIILTLQEQPGKAPFIGCAGGRLEPNEDPLESAKRELLEETGYEAGEMVLWRALQPVSKLDWVIYTFIAKDCRKVAEQKLDAGEKIELKLLDFEEFVETTTSDSSFMEIETLTELLRAKADPAKMADIKKLFGIT